MNPATHTKPKTRWLKWLGLLFIAPLAVGLAALALLFLLWNHAFDDATLLYTVSGCKNGPYSLQVFTYKNGDGYMQLVDQRGKRIAKSTFSHALEMTGFKWDEDCKRILIPSDQGYTFLGAG